MTATTSGVARVTIRAPRRRLDLVVPDQVPLAEVLPELLRRAGEAGELRPPAGAGFPPQPHGPLTQAAGGWALRRGDGAALAGDSPLAQQGVRDGDVLYLVPRAMLWPEPAYDDVVEEIAASARGRGHAWDATTTRTVALVAAGAVLLGGLIALLTLGPPWSVPGTIALFAAVVLIGLGVLLSRALGDGVTGAASAGFGLPYAAAGGALLVAGDPPLRSAGPGALVVGAAALLFASVLGAVGVGHGLRVFAAGVTVGAFGTLGAVLAALISGRGGAAVLTVAVVAGIGAAPVLAVRLGRLPLPVVSASPETLAAERRPDRPQIRAAVTRADELLIGALAGIALLAVACVVALGPRGAGPALGAVAGLALLLRSRLFPTVAARLPLVAGGLAALAVAGWALLGGASTTVRLLAVAVALVTVAALIATAALAPRRRGDGSPYLARLADILDIVAVVALAPLACVVLDLFAWVRGLAG
ncbi:type VII secretion integral membrane protein EccD [Luedemannella helvata]|uniref:EccD-like transmembrane domain-containing protein n=1 Tax=Luedemannella helvata TaxID=349315 RepID=A0ABN2KE08_9ACTN